ncbi:hypothetical protein K7X08_013999 [Anisodus acutangulus]|uniref:Carboxypeptidase A inhibitor-like domain-containing protein n=1 Tax=Anisodus acutangulus TaxID=402998 RepID=A0A9Q1LLA2_9SOLA|nr:hypothetical protein K7X08_013999 [Anisodus acutangulus]
MANKCLSHKLSFFFGILLVTLTVNSLWSSNTRAVALRDLPLEVQVIEQIILPELSYTVHCFEQCENNWDCRKLPDCGYCRKPSSRSPIKRCLTPR